VRVFFVEFNIFQSLIDTFVTVEATVEFSISGTVYPTALKIYSYRPNVFELPLDKRLQACDLLRLFLCLGIAFNLYCKLRYHMPSGDKGAFAILILVDFGIVSFFIAALITSYFQSGKSTEEILSQAQGSYPNLLGKA
jgi:hypothetical protein